MKTVKLLMFAICAILLVGCATAPATKGTSIPFSQMRASQAERDYYQKQFEKANEDALKNAKKTGTAPQFVQHQGDLITILNTYQWTWGGTDVARSDAVLTITGADGKERHEFIGGNNVAGENIGTEAVEQGAGIFGRWLGRSRVNSNVQGSSATSNSKSGADANAGANVNVP